MTTTIKSKPAVKAQKTEAPVKPKKASATSTIFSLFAPEATEVFVMGDFNDWQTDDLKARKLKDGIWTKSVPLKPGIYHYLFLVDGAWWTDPVNPNRVQNPFGSENSVIEIR